MAFEIAEQGALFFATGWACQKAPEEISDDGFVAFVIRHGLGGGCFSHLNEHGVVQQRESLERRVAAVALSHADFTGGRIEDCEGGEGGGTLGPGVEAASIAIFSCGNRPLGIAVGGSGDAGGLGRVDSGATHLVGK